MMNQTVNEAYTTTWRVYKITFKCDSYAYVGITNQPIPDRINGHIRIPVNAELSTRLRKGLEYDYETLHEVPVNGADGSIRDVYALERQEIFKLEKPLNIHGISDEAKRNPRFWGHEQSQANRRKKRKKRHVHSPREGFYRCSICAEKKPHTDFYKVKSRFNGLDSRCKPCRNFVSRRNMTSAEAREYIAGGGIIPENKERDKGWDKKKAIELYKSGLSCDKVAKRLGNISGRTVYNLVRKIGINRSVSEAKRLQRLQKNGNALTKSCGGEYFET